MGATGVAGAHGSGAMAIGRVNESGSRAPRDPLRAVRLLTNVFAWLGGAALVGNLLVAGNGIARVVLAAVVLLVLGSWWVRPRYDGWAVAVVEGVATAGAVLVLPAAQPVLAFLFGATTRRALHGGPWRYPVKSLVGLGGYAGGLGLSLSRLDRVDPDVVMAAVMPLLGLVIGTFALHETVRAVRAEQTARRTVGALLEATPVGLALLDENGTPRLHNARAREMFGWGDDAGTVVCPHGVGIVGCRDGCVVDPVEVEPRDGLVLSVHTGPVEQDTGPDHTVVAAVDVSGRRQWEQALRDKAERDELTGLASRAHFLHLVREAMGAETVVGLLVVDLDRFKDVNDADGHEVGDRYLQAAAARVRSALPPRAVAGRLGGDEFAVLAPGFDVRDTVRLAKSVLQSLNGAAEPFAASVGAAVSQAGADAAGLLRDADTAMYVAKRDGGNRVRQFRREMGEQALARQRDKADLRTAIDGGELVVHYQPIVDLATSAVTSAEALVRWQRPGRGLLGPDAFIGLAEETGLIVPLGEKVLEAACGQAVRWNGEGRSLGVTVNVSTRELATPGFLPRLDRVITSAGLAPNRLTVEVTESVWADEPAMRSLVAVREAGIRVALDDFGTGYSSLSYLQRYPFDVVKIDRSFTGALGRNGRTEGVIRCIIALAEVLGAKTVAEGIETPEQADWLRDAGCSYAQGYLFGRPADAAEWKAAASTGW
ncbi:putative bifunctional diguanylate cyclase/phosphodiesterase [Lentzea albida]|uniref:Diguanylate cyclase (GGDEF) domain-containing protein n=1 Tax=Lentzea albida TaxID=65499 RepID=A0A1H9EWB3_9PSEU|nr:EAL domain-containing protein [Lentzea albida]SEQ29951.1 diguanylate cyclase (GGDEF) domain-containing protein [Lentzea albida]